jgi:hypothetical protein
VPRIERNRRGVDERYNGIEYFSHESDSGPQMSKKQ